MHYVFRRISIAMVITIVLMKAMKLTAQLLLVLIISSCALEGELMAHQSAFLKHSYAMANVIVKTTVTRKQLAVSKNYTHFTRYSIAKVLSNTIFYHIQPPVPAHR